MLKGGLLLAHKAASRLLVEPMGKILRSEVQLLHGLVSAWLSSGLNIGHVCAKDPVVGHLLGFQTQLSLVTQ